MKSWINWQTVIRPMGTVLFAIILFITPIWTQAAQADDLGLIPAAEEYIQTVQEARAVFDTLATDAESFLQGSSEVQQTFQDLPKDLERLAAAPDVETRTQIQSEITTKQQALKTFAQSFSTWLSKAELADEQYSQAVEAANDKFEAAIEAAEDSLKTQTHGKVKALKQTFKQTSKLISSLADSSTKAASGKGTFVQAQFDEQLTALSTALGQVDEAVKSLTN